MKLQTRLQSQLPDRLILMNRKTFLENEIRHHDFLYWKSNAPKISDAEYDKLKRELEVLDPDNQLINKVHSPRVLSDGKIKQAGGGFSLR